MRRVFLLFTLVAIVAFWGCQQQETALEIPMPPTGLELNATSDGLGVILSWDASSDSVEGYIVYFKPTGQTEFSVIDTVQGTSYTHDPQGLTGTYYVTAFNKSGESDPSGQMTTIPIATGDVVVYEFDNPEGPAGYGWDRDAGTGAAFPMSDTASIKAVDLYVTDDASGQNGPFFFFSPNLAPSDGGAGDWLPQGNWHQSYFKEISPDEANGTLPLAENNYIDGIQIAGNSYYAVNTYDNHYAVVLIDGDVSPNGTVHIKSWFQMVPGLRLMRH